jgi:hypothetical protein
MRNIVLALSVLLLLSCEGKKTTPIFKDSNGRMNHVLLVVKNSHWNTAIGNKLKDIIMTPVIGMPQEENQFDISQVPSDSFGSMLKGSRNVLIVEIDTMNAFQEKQNVYAKPQQIVKISGASEEEVINVLELYKDQLISTFKKADLKVVQNSHLKKAYAKKTFKTLTNMGIEMTIPKMFRLVEDTGDFLWLRQHLSGGIAKGDSNSNLLVYAVPIPKDKSQLVSTISKMRDSIGKKFLPGSKENMYMITEKAYTPRVFKTKHNEKTTYVTYGKWELLNDFMAGPFMNFAIEDIENNRWIVVEGFTYAPSVEKRDYMFELEAIIKSTKLN